MHFWIDKRSQACGYNGRHRVPASLSTGYRRRTRSKPMVTPVHRFQSMESGVAQQIHRQQPPTTRTRPQQTLPPPSYSTPTISAADVNESTILRPDPGPDISSSSYFGPQAEEETEQRAYSPTKVELVRYTVWGTFVLATISVSFAKYSMGHEEVGELLLICILLTLATILICVLGLFRSSNANRDFMNAQSQTTRSGLNETTPIAEELQPVPTLSASQNRPRPRSSEPPPPPYHIAILLPPKDSSPDESPPPTYEKATS